MKMTEFIHLNVHSHYSILEACATPSSYLNKIANFGSSSLALTDNGAMFGALEFYKKAKSLGIKPIIGQRTFIAPNSRFEKSKNSSGGRNFYAMILLAKNNTGYKNLIKLSSLGFTEGFYYKARIDKELLEKYCEGIIALSDGFSGVVGSHIIRGDLEMAIENAKYFKKLFGNDFYLEIQDHKLDQSQELISETVRIARKYEIPLVATNNVHYLERDHAVAHNVMLYIQTATAANTGTFDVENLRFGSDEFYLKSPEEMVEIFKGYPDAIANTVKIAGDCNVELDLSTNHMPGFPIPERSKAKDLDEYLAELVGEGLEMRFGENITSEIKERADFELSVIKNMGFPGYFLIVWDFIKAGRELGVSVGPGRGSAAGSIVAYALEITNVNPLKYNLLFERFLNPERISMPDIDIDFSDEKRDVVIDYVKKKYGEEAVAQIITFGKLSSKAVLTDVGRVLGVPLSKIKDITKKIPSTFGKVKPIAEAIEIPELKWVKDICDKVAKNPNTSSEDDFKLSKLIEYSLVLEGMVRNTGIHAAGVVIAPRELTDFVPIHKSSRSREQSLDVATQFSMNDLEDAGLLKMDFLGLKTLSIIDNILEMIRENHNTKINIDEISLEDEKTYDLFGRGETMGVFQFESGGMQDYLRKLKPENLEEITAMNALYRPGPMENIPEFIDRKFGRKPIEYLDKATMEPSLRATYGIIIYQEQVMILVQDIAGFSLGEADLLRRAMGKKKTKEMNQMKPKFIEGATKKNIEEKRAVTIWKLIEKFANYGFNKSHSLAYSYLAYQTAWLKANYTAEFIAANMTAEINDQDKIVKLRDESRKFDIKLLPPDINKSVYKFLARDNIIYFGLAAIKNVGIPAVNHIVDARKNKEFTSFYDFISRVDTRLINRKSLEALICSGAFDSLQDDGMEKRSRLFASIDRALDYAKSKDEEKNMQMDSMFGDISGGGNDEPKLIEMEMWDDGLKLSREKEFLNFYVTGHPLYKYEPHLSSLPNMDTINSSEEILGEEVTLCGMIASVRTQLDKRENPIAFVELEDFKGKCQLFFWSKEYDKYKDLIKKDAFIFIKGKPREKEEDDTELKITVSEAYNVDDAIANYSNGYKVWIDLQDEEILDKIKKLKEICSGSPDKYYIAFNVTDDSSNYKTVYLAEQTIHLDDETMQELVNLFGQNNVRFLSYSD